MTEVADARRRLVTSGSLLKTDFSEEERQFKANLPAFHSEIAISNVEREICAPPEEPSTQAVAPTPVTDAVKKPEQNPKIAKENRTENVESGSVSTPKSGERTLQPAQPKEQHLSTPEDDIFGDCTSPAQKNAFPEIAKQPAKTEPKAPVDDDIFGDDFFGGPATTKKEEEKTKTDVEKKFGVKVSDTPPPKVAVPVVEEDPFGDEPAEVIQEAPRGSRDLPCDPPPSTDDMDSESLEIDFKKYTADQLVEMKIDLKFLDMMNVLQKMLFKLPDVDLYALAGTVSGYMVDLKLDPTREDVQALSRMITELEMKRDALYGKLMLLQEHADALKHATDWITKVGPGYSQAKNEQARLAEIKMLTADVWLRHALVDRVHSSFDEAYSHLGRQMDAISRLVTCDQNRLKHMEMRRGMAPHDDTPPWEDPKPKAQHSPRTLPPTEKDSEEGEDKGELFNQKMSQPLDPKKYKDLQSLPTDTSKLSAKGGRTFQKGDLNW